MITSKTKAWLSSVMVLIVTVLFFSACSSEADEGVKTPPSNLPQAQIITELQNYNNSLVVMPDSRKLKWYQWVSVALSDAVGAYKGSKFGPLGAIIFGASASLSKYLEYKAPEAHHKPLDQDSFVAAYVVSKNKVDSLDYTLGTSYHLDSTSILVGILHNKILDCVEEVASKYDKEILISKLTPQEKKIIENKEFITLFIDLSDKPTTRLENTDIPVDGVMQLYLDVVQNKCENVQDLKNITQDYINTVKKSTELSAEEKQTLYNGFSVMAYSIDYWSIRIPASDLY